ncbi:MULTISPECIES: ribonucleoside-triphosphate reductase, adenosylcobalamin-dependent [unclassified Leptolyngbya]|uniref:ribonucleoside-triphosphate reductase, adenosylcobalamin-dependent n=1 Tax=unclassified Leptolyngbya TaxID=2650499 RepID=UPI0016865264|nr:MULTISPECIES: ribonucleoside-triphosphate reductase, adenosylcobalamin-dependent [unclassified Leptolyngbya]MBD1913282.1 ribonucleoside-triphosphate reductase, adenosylcobalamin-dependent [Leptolyngbya sp. FACHB-8]MBD2154371.1 ribonucleoside-triphosphate reductase, adenosylcobalamin-dependent [Leptolyngbya sp. FACHB-16]
MVQNIDRPSQTSPFPASAPAANPVFYRTYSRLGEVAANRRETWDDVCDRTLSGIIKLGKLTESEADLLKRMQRNLYSLPSGRWLWVGGTEWAERPENFSGAYNCTSTNVVDWRAFGLMMDLAMMGCGTGAVLEPKYINQLPAIRNPLVVKIVGEIGTVPPDQRQDRTEVIFEGNRVLIKVGDSRQGWVTSYQTLLELSTDERFSGEVGVEVDLGSVRPAGERLKGFGGMANPIRLPGLYERCARILNKAIGRQLNSVECCLLIDEAAACVVAGNIRRSAGMRQFDSEDTLAAAAKDNLWMQDANGNWRIDPERDSLRMANHTRVFHRKPTLEECVDAVRKQFYSGEGAIQWAGEAERRAQGEGRYGLNPCVTADTWVHTEHGPRQVKDLLGKQHSTYINGELFSTTPEGFFYSGTKPVLKLTTREGYELRLTGNHKVLKVTAQTQKAQYTDWVATEELQPGDRILLHNHRDITPWDGDGTQEEGWLLGNLLGDGSLAKTPWNDTAVLRYWEESQNEMSHHAVSLLQLAVGYEPTTAEACYHTQLKHRVIASTGLAKLAAQFGIVPGQKRITSVIEEASYGFYQGFLQGFFDADGSVQGTQNKGISVRLAQSNLDSLKAVQRMLARMGIVSTIYQGRRPAGYRLMPDSDRKLAPYYCQAQHELVIANDNLYWFQQIIGFREPHKAEKLNRVLEGYKRKLNRERFAVTVASIDADGIEAVYDCTVPGPACFDANGLVAHNCGEILGQNFHCNLAEVHLNQIDPKDLKAQEEAFTAAALSVASLLNHQFMEPRYQQSRLEDPIVGVSFTGLFDFFVKAFGVEWLHWWAEGRPDTMKGLEFKQKEQQYLSRWKEIVHQAVWEYCDRHQLNRPNRCTTVQPAGTKSLLTNASPGWHPPKAQRFIRRITFRKNDPVALACMEYGYNIVPSQSDKDEEGNLLNDPFDPRCTEWLVEIPVRVPWADMPGADEIIIENFSALAQFDFYMQVQKYYTAHNTSATIELNEHEVEPLAQAIYGAIANDEGYISAALLARFNAPFPRLPFEKIDRETFDRLEAEVKQRQRTTDFYAALSRYDSGDLFEAGPAGCDSDKCMFPEQK